MTEALSLEERVVGHLLRNRYSGFDFLEFRGDTRFVDSEDLRVIQSYLQREIPRNDKRLVEIRNKYPFLGANYYSTALGVLIRAISSCNYDVGSAVLSVISNPRDVGEESIRRLGKDVYNIAHDFGDHKQGAFVFLHELGIKLGLGNEVEKEVRDYADAYNSLWQEYFQREGRSPSDDFDRNKLQQSSDYKICLTSEYKKSMRSPLQEGDKEIISIISLLSPEKLREYASKYYAPKQKFVW